MKPNETFIYRFMAEYILNVTFVFAGRRRALSSRDKQTFFFHSLDLKID